MIVGTMKRKIVFLLFLLGSAVVVGIVIKFLNSRTPKEGEFRVEANPLVNVFLDNKQFGRTPLREKVKAGEYMVKLVPDLHEAVQRFSSLSEYELFGIVAQTGEFLDWCDTTDGALFPKIDEWMTEHVAALLLYREREANLPQGLPEDSPSIPRELRVLRGIKRQGTTALSTYCRFYADEWKRFDGSGAERLANQWDALADVTSTLSEVPRKLPTRSV